MDMCKLCHEVQLKHHSLGLIGWKCWYHKGCNWQNF